MHRTQIIENKKNNPKRNPRSLFLSVCLFLNLKMRAKLRPHSIAQTLEYPARMLGCRPHRIDHWARSYQTPRRPAPKGAEQSRSESSDVQWREPNLGNEAPRVHHASRRRGGGVGAGFVQSLARPGHCQDTRLRFLVVLLCRT